MNRRLRCLLFGSLLLAAPSVGLAYVDCIQVINVYPNGTETHCLDCNLYNDKTGDWVGEITNCEQDTNPGHGAV